MHEHDVIFLCSPSKSNVPAPPYHRAMNKSAIVNCRWTIRPVRSDGQSLLGKDGKEVSNLDYVYLEQVYPGQQMGRASAGAFFRSYPKKGA